MSTREEFVQAIELLGSCRSSVSCGCEVHEYQSRLLYVRCCDYLKAFEKRFGKYVQMRLIIRML